MNETQIIKILLITVSISVLFSSPSMNAAFAPRD